MKKNNLKQIAKILPSSRILPIIGVALLVRYALSRKNSGKKALKKDGRSQPDDVIVKDWGLKHNEVVIYDNRNNKLLTPNYRGHKVWWNIGDTNDTKKAIKFKQSFDKLFEPEGLTLVYTVSVEGHGYPRGGENWIKNPSTEYKNGTLLCNFIVKDEKTGLYRPLSKDSWLCIGTDYNTSIFTQNIHKYMLHDLYNCPPWNDIISYPQSKSR